jgi:hypothetical protein
MRPLIVVLLEGAAGEAAFMTGFERNADIVFAASYAPLLGVSHVGYYAYPITDTMIRAWIIING